MSPPQPLPRNFNFEVHFMGKGLGLNRLLTVPEESMSDFPTFKTKLSCLINEPFEMLYLDEENDLVPVDTEEEYREFFKFATRYLESGKEAVPLMIHTEAWPELTEQEESDIARRNGKISKPGKDDIFIEGMSHAGLEQLKENLKPLMEQLKDELRKEIVTEVKQSFLDNSNMTLNSPSTSGNTSAVNAETNTTEVNAVQNEATSNTLPRISSSPSGSFIKKLCLKDAAKLEKLELKRKKLLEKAMSLKELGWGNVIQDSSAIDLPFIMSGKATSIKDPAKTAGQIFIHTWIITNDGTCPWTNVTLQHHWSSMGLEPLDLVVRCPNLRPGYSAPISVRFKVAKMAKQLKSYWFFHFQRYLNGPMEKFGHYVLLSGTQLTKSVDPKNPDIHCKKLKLEKKTAIGSKLQKLRLESTRSKICNCVSGVGNQEEQGDFLRIKPAKSSETPKTCAEMAEAALASTQIAAEMARGAAIAKFRRLMDQKKTDAPNKSDENKLNTLEEAAMAALAKMELGEGVRAETAQHSQPPSTALNFVESGSDTDVNNEESDDPDFVIVDACNELPSDNEDNGAAVSSSTEKELNQAQATRISQEQAVPQSKNTVESGESVANVKPNPIPMFKGATMHPENVPHFFATAPSSQINADNLKNSAQPTYQLNSPTHAFHLPINPLSTTDPFNMAPGTDDAVDNYYSNREQQSRALYNKYKQAQQNSATTPYWYCKKSTADIGHSPITYVVPDEQSQTIVNSMPKKDVEENMINLNDIDSPIIVVRGSPISCCETVTSSVLTSAVSSTTTAMEQAAPKATAVAAPKATAFVAPKATVAAAPIEQPAATPQQEPTIEILPQALVDGAINVAASAYSTAWNALNNLRPKEGKISSEFDPVFENNMALLVEMGFRNIERNALLLKQHKNDLSQVIGIICSTPPSDDFRGLSID